MVDPEKWSQPRILKVYWTENPLSIGGNGNLALRGVDWEHAFACEQPPPGRRAARRVIARPAGADPGRGPLRHWSLADPPQESRRPLAKRAGFRLFGGGR